MAEPLKNYYNRELLSSMAEVMLRHLDDFNPEEFMNLVFNDEWASLELKQRMRHIATAMQKFLDPDYIKSLEQIEMIYGDIKDVSTGIYGFLYMIFPDYVEVYGIDHYKESIGAMEKITQFASCEFAIRPYILKYFDKTMDQMLIWSKHPHHLVRRLASEGSRPWLPWAMAVPALKKDPSRILPILENLKNEPTEIVRRSVANNLNDISRMHPEVVKEISHRWLGNSNETNRLIKHACRTLLKSGDQETMKMFGYGDIKDFQFSNFALENETVKIGENIIFHFDLENISSTSKKVRLEYGLYYLKANGTLSRKVFKISEKEMQAYSQTRVTKKQSFKPVTTRKLYPGRHQVSVIVNGHEMGKLDFELLA